MYGGGGGGGRGGKMPPLKNILLLGAGGNRLERCNMLNSLSYAYLHDVHLMAQHENITQHEVHVRLSVRQHLSNRFWQTFSLARNIQTTFFFFQLLLNRQQRFNPETRAFLRLTGLFNKSWKKKKVVWMDLSNPQCTSLPIGNAYWEWNPCARLLHWNIKDASVATLTNVNFH